MKQKKKTVPDIVGRKGDSQPLVMVTGYDYTSARLLDMAGVDIILVGDSASMVMLGEESTLPISLDEILVFTRGVTRAAEHALVVADLPFLSYGLDSSESVRNAGRLLKEGGAAAVKLEGGEELVDHVRHLTRCNIPVMGHLGLTPQSFHQMGGHRLQGRDIKAAKKLFKDAQCLVEAGVFAIVLEGIPALVAEAVTGSVEVPTIGIGAGPGCDGQVLVWQDLLGMNLSFRPRFVKQYARLEETILDALGGFCQEVRDGGFPVEQHCYPLRDKELASWLAARARDDR